MIRSEIIQMTRDEVPGIDTRSVSDTLMQNWCLEGNKDFCARARCIIDQAGTTITTTAGDTYWDLTAEITNFYDIDTLLGGVLYNNKPLVNTSIAELDEETNGAWRSYSAGTPLKWFRRGQYLYVERAIDASADDLLIYSVLLPDDWNTNIAPYNALTYLAPYHYGMVLYLKWRALSKIGKKEAAATAMAEYFEYAKWTKGQLGATKFIPIYLTKRV